MLKVTTSPVVGNYTSFLDATFDYSSTSLIPAFEVSIDNPLSSDFIKNEINWADKEKENNNKDINSTRISLHEMDETTLKKLEPVLEQVSKDNIMRMLDELVAIRPDMFNYWGYDKSTPASIFFSRILDIKVHLVKDNTNNKFSPHFDGRNSFGTIIINLMDNEVATQLFDYGEISYFYKNIVNSNWENRFIDNIIYEAPKENGNGIFFVNCETTFHGVGMGANPTRDRYTLFVMLNLNI
jgi:hypothetical protein